MKFSDSKYPMDLKKDMKLKELGRLTAKLQARIAKERRISSGLRQEVKKLRSELIKASQCGDSDELDRGSHLCTNPDSESPYCLYTKDFDSCDNCGEPEERK